MHNSAEDNRVSSDEIDLRELFLVLKHRKKIIYTTVALATLSAIVFTYYIAKPVYSVKSMIQIGGIVTNKKTTSASDIKEKLIYTYKNTNFPYLHSVVIPKISKTILSLEVFTRNNEEGTKYIQTIINKIILDSDEKIYSHIKETKKQIKLFEDDLLSSRENYASIKNSISDMNKEVVALSKVDPALAAIYALQVSQKDSVLSGIKNTMITIKNKIEELKDSISTNNIEFTKMIDTIQVLENPIKPKKVLIVVVAFITSLIFSIFLVFFLNFMEGMEKEDD